MMYDYKWMLSMLLLVTLILSACQPIMPLESTVPVEMAPAEEAVMVTNAADLAGVWQVLGVDFDFYHQFNEDGTLRAAESPGMLADQPLLVGEFWFDDAQLHMKELEVFGIPACGDEPAIYEARLLANGNLSLTKMADSCAPRVDSTQQVHAPVQIAQASLDEGLVAEIEALVEQVMEDAKIPGMSLGVVKDGEVVYANGFGLAEHGSNRAMTQQTQIAVASLSKAFTAAAIMQLEDQGLVDLDAPVTNYLPYFKLADERYQNLTIRHLLSNTSGLAFPDYEALYGYSPTPVTNPEMLEEYVRSLADRSLEADPADNFFIYSNDNWDILGDVIAKVSGQPYEEYVTEHIMAPLGMARSTFFADEADPTLASAYHWQDEAGEIQSEALSPTYYQIHTPSQGLISNAEDLLKWAQLHLNQGEVNGQQILPAAAYAEMWAPQTEINWGLGGFFQDWGYGWVIAEEHGHPIRWWGGLAIGANAALMLMPDDNMGLFVAVNRLTDYSENPPWYAYEMAFSLCDMLMGVDEQP